MSAKFACCLLIVPIVALLPAAWGYFEGCDNVYQLQVGTSYVESPYYPSNYPAGTACRYKFVAPLDYYIRMQCTLNLPSNGGQCTTDNFYLDNEGDLQMRGAENFCGSGSFTRESLFTQLVFGYIAQSNSATGSFRCQLTVLKQDCTCGWSINSRIVNGQQAAATEYPGMVALKDITKNRPSFCGGAIVSHRHIVTAAHCTAQISQASNIRAIVGTNDLQNPSSSRYYAQYAIQQMISHEQYTDNPYILNDIAVLITTSSMQWSRGVGPICLPPTGSSQTFAYDTVDVIGWGTVSFAGPTSNTLQKISLAVVNNADCQTEYNDVATINAGHMCTYDYTGNSRDSCQYDSGGPTILRLSKQFLVGLISFGKGCATGSYPMGVNTRITSYISWIRQKIGYSNCVVSL